MNPSKAYDPSLHEQGSPAADGECSYHREDGRERGPCTRDAVVSYRDDGGVWHAGCSAALEQLVEAGEIEPLGQGA